jgi:hypothetical protein
MSRPGIPYFLLLLMCSAQLDDAWVVAVASPRPCLSDDDDEYLPVERRHDLDHSSQRQRPVPSVVQLSANHPVSPILVQLSRAATIPSGLTVPCSLYVFMSLQR